MKSTGSTTDLPFPVTKIAFGVCENDLNDSSWYLTTVGIGELGGPLDHAQSPSLIYPTGWQEDVRMSESSKIWNTHASRWDTL